MPHRAVDALTERLEKVGVDYKAKLDEQAAKVTALEASVAAAAAAGLPAPRNVAAVLAGEIVDITWCTDKMQATAKVVLKKEMSKFVDEVIKEKVAVGDCLAGRLAELDVAIKGATGDAPALEGLYWRKLEVLRVWTRLGVPTREGVQ